MAAQFGRRLRRGATSGAIVAAAVAALAASQGPGAIPPPTDNLNGDRAIGAGDATSPAGGIDGGSATGDSPYYTDLPPLNSPNRPGALPTSPTVPIVTGPAAAGIPSTVLAAYRRAEASVRATDPSCNLPWQLLAGIGKVESGQARGGRVDANGTTLAPILGPVLDGVGFANISDTDDGAFDGDTTHDRAVGPMQFIPSTWATWGQDANGDGKKDPNNIYDAAQAAGMYLCAGGRNLAIKADLDRAILSYNRSTEYLNTVLSWFEYYGRGAHTVPDGTGVLPVDRSDRPVTGRTVRPSGSASPDSPAPSTSPSPHKPAPKPSETTPPSPAPKPTEPTKPPTTDPTRPPVATPVEVPPTLRVARLRPGTAVLTAVTESTFAQAATVTAVDASGRPVAGVSVRFELPATTDARFPAGATTVTVTSDARGVAKAPALRAGAKAEPFTIRATVPGRSLPAAELKATVEVRKADALARIGDTALTAQTGAGYAGVTVEARLGGALAAGVSVTAVVADSTDAPTQSADGPSFGKDAAGNPIRTRVLKTDAQGRLSIGDLVAGEKAGDYVLWLTAPGGGTVKLTLTVTAPATTPPPTTEPTPDPAPTTEPAPTASGSTSSSPSTSPSPTG
ncbi:MULTISPECIES: lytic murein transglycosylase [Streptomyces]|uniref:Lytic murein transglycosylase n=2 Tax=Streptomyces TaxID=1883 RepID=A0ABU4KAT6_9ACTN|nr:lytic murein transglycosylase [Streptomyces roseolus]MDX2294883.1 lytic murein transglycosylase [Streptomyces roseolus]